MARSGDYNERYARFSKRIEKGLIVLVMGLMLVMLTGELIYQFEPVRKFLIETERLEGVSAMP
jgi:hypothetical protein